MGCTASRMQAATDAGGGSRSGVCGCGQTWNHGWRREIVKGKEHGGCGSRKNNIVVVDSEDGDKNKERNERDDDRIWSPGSPSFRDYLFVGSFDSSEGNAIAEAAAGACESVDKPVPPPEIMHPRKGSSKGQTRWGCGMGGLRTQIQSKISPSPMLH